jgi:hypothetical protein
MAERTLRSPASDRIEFRVGINLGDVIVEGDDIYGDGVNVAARLEALAEPDGIRVRIKTVDLEIRRIHPRLADRVRAHVFLYMLAYYLTWHMRRGRASCRSTRTTARPPLRPDLTSGHRQGVGPEQRPRPSAGALPNAAQSTASAA